jgi:hypothetical protein
MKWDMYAAWQHFLESRIGWPYDWKDFWGLATHLDTHEQGYRIHSRKAVSGWTGGVVPRTVEIAS